MRREGEGDDAARADRAPRQNGRKRPENQAAAPDAETGGETLFFKWLVRRFSQIDGYRCLSLIRALAVVNCQSALA